MSTITLVMYSSTSTISLLRTRVRVLKKYEYEYTSTITPSLLDADTNILKSNSFLHLPNMFSIFFIAALLVI